MIGSKSTIEEELLGLEMHVIKYADTLNTEAVWLFLATLGCWGVTQYYFQIAALIFTVYLFGDRLLKKLDERRSFNALIEIVREKIESGSYDVDYKKARLYDLSVLRKRDLTFVSSMKRSKTFAVAWCFYAVTIAYCLLHIPMTSQNG